jgi:predicted Zn-dependent protease
LPQVLFFIGYYSNYKGNVMRKLLILLFSGLLLFTGCATVEYTGRKRFIIISEEEEIALGNEAYSEFIKDATLSQDKDQVDLLNRVGNRIAAAVDKPEFTWEFSLVDDPETVNAFALPGGKVVFYSGILPLCQNEEGIAVVMGHEAGHVIARHGAERISQGMVTNLVGSALAAAIAGKTPEAQIAILNGYGYAATVGVMLPFSRKHEYEADYIGLILMAKAGYDPGAAVDFWERMLEYSKGSVPEFFSTHPNDENRINAMKQNLPEAMKYYEESMAR